MKPIQDHKADIFNVLRRSVNSASKTSHQGGLAGWSCAASFDCADTIQLPTNNAATTATRLTVESNAIVRAGSESCHAHTAMPIVPGTHNTRPAANAALGMAVRSGRLARYAMIAIPKSMVMGIQKAQKRGVHGRA